MVVTAGDGAGGEVDATVHETFRASIRFLNSAADSGLETSNADKLRLYGYFKQATEGPCTLPEPPASDLVALTKWRAWTLTSRLSRAAAMRGYVRIVDGLAPGWREREGCAAPELDSPRHRANSASIKDGAPGDRATLCGTLFRKAEGDRTWAQRYFVLEGRILFQYLSTMDNYPDGVVYLAGCTIVLSPSLADQAPVTGDSLYAFIVEHAQTNKTYKLASRSLADAKRWVDELRRGSSAPEEPSEDDHDGSGALPTGARSTRTVTRDAQPASDAPTTWAGNPARERRATSDAEEHDADVEDSQEERDNADAFETSAALADHGLEHEEQLRINSLIGSYAQVEPADTGDSDSSPTARYAAYKQAQAQRSSETSAAAAQRGSETGPDAGEQDAAKEAAWREVAARFEFPEEYAAVVGRSVENLVRVTSDLDAYWEPNFELDGVECLTSRTSVPSAAAALGKTRINATGLSILDTFWDLSRRHRIDPQFAKGRTVEQYGSQTRLEHLVFKAIWPTTARDFCKLSHWRILEDGTTIVIASGSVTHPRCPHRRGAIRGHIFGSGLVIKQISASPPVSEVFYYIQSDPMGSVPSVFIRKVQGRRPLVLQQLRNAVEAQMRKDQARQPAGAAASAAVAVTASAPATFIANANKYVPPSLGSRWGSSRATVGSPGARQPRSRASTSQLPSRRRLTLPRRMHLNPASEPGREGARFVRRDSSGQYDPSAAPHDWADVTVAEDGARLSRAGPDTARSASFAGLPAAATLVELAVLVLVGGGLLSIDALPGTAHKWISFAALLFIAWQVLLSIIVGRHATARQKVWMGTWDAPSASGVLVNLAIDVSNATRWVNAQRAKLVREPRAKAVHKPAALVHLVIKALGICLAETPEVNGHLCMGHFIRAETVDVSCVVICGGSSAVLVKVPCADTLSVQEIADLLASAHKSRVADGDNPLNHVAVQFLALVLPLWLIRRVVRGLCFLACGLGIGVPSIIDAFPFGAACVSNVGMLGVEMAFPPSNPDSNIPVHISLGAVRDQAVVVQNLVVARPVANLCCTIDHRYLDATQGARLANRIRAILQDPDQYFGSPLGQF